MTWKDLLKNQRVKQHQTSHEELHDLRAMVEGRIFLHAQDDPKQRAKIVRELSKGGSDSIAKVEPYLTDPVLDVRVEAVKAIAYISTQRSLDPLIKALNDNDAEIQIRATDGLVNFYLPGYARTGLGASFRRIGTSIKSKLELTSLFNSTYFDSDTLDRK